MGKKKNFENKETFAERHPRINAMTSITINTPVPESPRLCTNLVTMSAPPIPRNAEENAFAPKTMTKHIAVVLAVSSIESWMIFQFSLP